MITLNQLNCSRCYRFVDNNLKSYKVECIRFYKENKVVIQVDNGWLTVRKQGWTVDLKSLDLPISEIKAKRKEKLDGNEVFYMSLGTEKYGSEKICVLYIPADMLGIKFAEYKKQSDYVQAIYTGEQGIYIEKFVGTLNCKLRFLREEYARYYKKVDEYALMVTKEEVFDEFFNKLVELKEAIKAEQKRVYNLTVEEAVKEMKEV